MAGNREYKSDLFGMLMEEPGYALEVYNALNQSDYRDPGLVGRTGSCWQNARFYGSICSL